MKKQLSKHLPKAVKSTLKKINNSLRDTVFMMNPSNSMIPPPSKWRDVGSKYYLYVGKEFKNYLVVLARLKRDMKVLDVGCGNGRMAIPLTKYLSLKGEYHGFDIVKKSIDWCQNKITTKFKNFHFKHSNVFNKHYNQDGKILANDFRFEHSDNYFDVIFLSSVFTHMLPKDLENYVKEISRVLKPRGRCLVTFFILNPESVELINLGKSFYNIQFKINNNCYSARKEDKEFCIGYKEDYLKDLFNDNGLNIESPIQYGNWCDREDYLSFQDIIIFRKKN